MPIKFEEESTAVTGQTADKDYFLDSAGNVTTDEEKAATLLIRKGQDILKHQAEKYPAIVKSKAKPADEKAAAKPENKAKSPSANK